MYKYVISPFGTNYNLDTINNGLALNSPKILAAYIHPPLGGYYDRRRPEFIADTSKETIKNIENQINLLKKYNIQIQATFNPIELKINGTIDTIYSDIAKYISLFGAPDYILTFDKSAPAIKDKYPNLKLARTVNENNLNFDINNDILSLYDIIVFKTHLLDINLFKEIKNRYNVELEVLFAPGCNPVCCVPCNNCNLRFDNYNSKVGLEYAFANQFLLPQEIKGLMQYIDYIKIGPGQLDYADWAIKWYETPRDNYGYLSGGYSKGADLEKYNKYMTDLNKMPVEFFDKVMTIKNEIWSKNLGKQIIL